ncbi:helix-turn-helix domain-containing protein [Thiospirochaeta perfilievii]|uniref:Helix-turn-helix domain-containing protein n=1 Tax=Thiospirochaeta perfilievii TaxID=252967 RepID=A0A5C1QDE8_9SPIO|nr:helix-turn-helix domain-containing protein [Thiospirochaeta perfilievii]QEN05378.1 helix-turn-helix domain-containing protein [Thiospirochaeta perfilievii]
MRSLRDLLLNKREEKGFTINQVAYETNISKKYIEALEEEDFSVFPAEAYLLGFLRNYAEFLGLDYDLVYGEYQNCLLRDEPTPLSELMGVNKKIEIKPWMIYIPVIILTLIFALPPVVRKVNNFIDDRKEALRIAGEKQSKNYIITTDYSDQKVRVDDSFTLDIGDEKVTYLIREIDSNLILTESYKGDERVITLKLGSEVESDFVYKNEKYIVSLFLKDIGGFSDNSAIMKVKYDIKEVAVFSSSDLSLDSEDSTLKDSKVILVKKYTPEPYSLSIKFEGDILFRYQAKGEELKEFFYQKNSVLSMDVTKSIQIWTSNAGLTKLKINGETLVLGRTGEVHVFSLRWLYIKDKDEYRLEYATAY